VYDPTRTAAAVAGEDDLMPRVCTVCAHADRGSIDAALVTEEPFRHIAARTGTSTAALQRHKAEHLPVRLVKAKAAEEVAHADGLLEQVRGLQARALAILSRAEEAGDLRTALGAIREARGNLELLAKLLGEIDERPAVNLLLDPGWNAVRSALLSALAPYPDARAAAAAALGAGERNGYEPAGV
jgi:hypothetical protein